MTAELVRFGVAMDAELLARFDERIARRGYATRSEALRDLVRADLASEHIERGGHAAATLTIVYDHHVRELTEKLTAMQHDLGHAVISTLHVHLDHDHCLEVIVMRGHADKLRLAADRLISTKGVEHGRLVITALPGQVSGSHEHGSSHHGSHLDPQQHLHQHDHDHDHDHDHIENEKTGHDRAISVHAHDSPRGVRSKSTAAPRNKQPR
jgi:CopG family transcriptional regulator, nickel-responsive regulator